MDYIEAVTWVIIGIAGVFLIVAAVTMDDY